MFGLLISAGVFFGLWIGHNVTRDYVARRLRFVDAIHKPWVPVVAGGAAWALALPVTALLPFVGPGTALAAGVAVGFGVLNGAREVRRYLPR
jgi:hypothetical protein